MEMFGGERCHVVHSHVRSERLYISAKTRRLRGWAFVVGSFPNADITEADKNRWREIAKEGTEQDFQDMTTYSNWLRQQPVDVQVSMVDRMREWSVQEWGLKISQLHRFSNYKEIAPGCWLPMSIEASLRKGRGEGRYDCVKTVMTVTKVSVGNGVEALKGMLPTPREGDKVIDSRLGATVRYPFDPDRKEMEIQKLAAAQREKDQRHLTDKAARVADLKKLIGLGLGKLTWMGGIWLNGRLPSDADLRKKPMLLHFWFKECGPCKNDYPKLNKLGDRFHVVGIHIPTKDLEGVKSAIEKGKMNYPTFVAPDLGDPSFVAGLPVREFPTCLLVDKNSRIESFGSLVDVIKRR